MNKRLKFSRASSSSLSIALTYRLATPRAAQTSEELAVFLQKLGHTVYTSPEQNKILGTKEIPARKGMDFLDLMIVLGGDGTYLRGVRLLRGAQVPILGVNLGSLGFLTPVQEGDLFAEVSQVLNGKYQLVPRSLLEVNLVRKKKIVHSSQALNDIVIERGSQSRLILLQVQSGGQKVTETKADGLIVASPTGSTAYNLAAGGPILDPEAPVVAVTAIAPHVLTNRPLILPDHRELILSVLGHPQREPCGRLVVDGQFVDEVRTDDEVRVVRSKEKHWMIRPQGFNDFQLIQKKLTHPTISLP